MIEEYLAHHFEPKPNDRFDIEPYKPAAQPAGVAGLSVRDLKPTDLQSVGVQFFTLQNLRNFVNGKILNNPIFAIIFIDNLQMIYLNYNYDFQVKIHKFLSPQRLHGKTYYPSK